MSAHAVRLRYATDGGGDVLDVTADVEGAVRASGIREGVACVAVVGSTAAVTTMEFEPGGVHDLRATLDRLVPSHGDYEHNRLNHDTNSHAHIRAAIVGPSETLPVLDGRITLGTWQQIVLVDFDDRPRERQVIVQVVG